MRAGPRIPPNHGCGRRTDLTIVATVLQRVALSSPFKKKSMETHDGLLTVSEINIARASRKTMTRKRIEESGEREEEIMEISRK